MSRNDKSEIFWQALVLGVFIWLAFAGFVPTFVDGIGGFVVGVLIAAGLWTVAYILHRLTIRFLDRRDVGRSRLREDAGEERK